MQRMSSGGREGHLPLYFAALATGIHGPGLGFRPFRTATSLDGSGRRGALRSEVKEEAPCRRRGTFAAQSAPQPLIPPPSASRLPRHAPSPATHTMNLWDRTVALAKRIVH